MIKVIVVLLVSPLCLAAPQVSQPGFGDASPDEIAQIRSGAYLETFDQAPQYSFNWKVADDKEQTYMSMEENRNGDDVTGSYQYVDPLGSLIIVNYRAGADGYSETREIKQNFVQIRSRPVSGDHTVSRVAQPLSPPAPVRPAPLPSRLSVPVAPIPVQVAPIPAPIPVRAVEASNTGNQASSSISDIFGSGGNFNVRFNT